MDSPGYRASLISQTKHHARPNVLNPRTGKGSLSLAGPKLARELQINFRAGCPVDRGESAGGRVGDTQTRGTAENSLFALAGLRFELGVGRGDDRMAIVFHPVLGHSVPLPGITMATTTARVDRSTRLSVNSAAIFTLEVGAVRDVQA